MKTMSVIFGLLMVAGASAQVPAPKEDALAGYLAYAGVAVERFQLPKLTRWEVVGRYRVVVWPRLSEAYLLTVEPPCFDLEIAQELALTSKAQVVSRTFDSVQLDRGSCRITEILPIDYKKYLADRKEAKKSAKS